MVTWEVVGMDEESSSIMPSLLVFAGESVIDSVRMHSFNPRQNDNCFGLFDLDQAFAQHMVIGSTYCNIKYSKILFFTFYNRFFVFPALDGNEVLCRYFLLNYLVN